MPAHFPYPRLGPGFRPKPEWITGILKKLRWFGAFRPGTRSRSAKSLSAIKPKCFPSSYGILRNHNDAEDIAQQVFAKIYFSIQSFDFRSSLLTWIYKITVNECYDYLRKKRVRKLVYESDFSEEDAQRMQNSESAVGQEPAVDTQLARKDLVIKLLAKLSNEDRSLLLLKEVEGHSVEELSQMTGMNENTIKVKLFRARQKLLKVAQRLMRGGQSLA